MVGVTSGKRRRSASIKAAVEDRPAPAAAATSSTSIGIQIAGSDTQPGIEDLPAELIERCLGFLDGHSLASARLVCRKWHGLIDAAPWDTLQKVHYRTLTVTAQRGLEIIMEKFGDEAVLDVDELPPPEPKPKRRKIDDATEKAVDTQGESSGASGVGSRRVVPKQKRSSLSRSRIGATLKITDRLSQAEMPHLMKYFKHITADRLVLQSLSGKGLMTMLLIFKRMCLRTKILVLDFCNFNGIKSQLLFDFLKPRRGRLQEVQLSSCRDMGTSFSPAEFWAGLGGLSGPFPTLRLKDHYSNSPWMDELATLMLGLPSPPWMLDIDGVSPPQEAVHDRLLNWYAEDPELGPILQEAARQRSELKRQNSVDHSPSSSSPAVSARSTGVQATAGSQGEPSTSRPASPASPPKKPKRRNYIIKIDNCRGIRLGRFWNETQRSVLEPNGIRIQPELCKVLEQCFDGRSRYSTHRNRMVLRRPDGGRFSIYLQR